MLAKMTDALHMRDSKSIDLTKEIDYVKDDLKPLKDEFDWQPDQNFKDNI